jgi:hypothetical protein
VYQSVAGAVDTAHGVSHIVQEVSQRDANIHGQDTQYVYAINLLDHFYYLGVFVAYFHDCHPTKKEIIGTRMVIFFTIFPREINKTKIVLVYTFLPLHP